MTQPIVHKLSLTQIAAAYWPILVCSFVVAVVMTPICRSLALRWGIVDRPDDWLKPHKKPIPYLGGVAIYLAWAAGIVFAMWWLTRQTTDSGVHIAIDQRLMFGVLLGGTAMMLLGLVDDLRSIHPLIKLAGNIAVALILVNFGIGHELLASFFRQIGVQFAPNERWLLWVYSVPLSTVIVIVTCNATNLLDGLDGLCSGVLGIIAFGFLVLAVHMHTYATDWQPEAAHRVVISLAMMGAALGFLPFNRNPATIFMGDAGSILLGFTAAVMIIMFADASTFRCMIGAFVVVGLPISDMVLAMVRRWRAQRPVLMGDRSHFYDQLRDRGYSVKQVVVISYVLAAVFAAFGCLVPIFLRTRHAPLAYGILLLAVLVAIKKYRMVRVDSPAS